MAEFKCSKSDCLGIIVEPEDLRQGKIENKIADARTIAIICDCPEGCPIGEFSKVNERGIQVARWQADPSLLLVSK